MGLFRKLGVGLIKVIDGAITLAVVIGAIAVCAAVATIGFAFAAGIVAAIGAAPPLSIGITAGVFAIGAMITKSGIKNHAGSSIKCKPIFAFPQQQSDTGFSSYVPKQSPGNDWRNAAQKNNKTDDATIKAIQESQRIAQWQRESASAKMAGRPPPPAPHF